MFDLVMGIIETKEIISVDIETNGQPLFFNNKIVCITFAWGEGQAAYWPILDKGQPFWDANTFKYMQAKWNSIVSSKHTIYHNGFYDTRILKHWGFSYGNYFFDTQMAAKVVDNTHISLRLKNLARLYTDMGGYDDQLELIKAEFKIHNDYSAIPTEILKEYSIKDADCTYRLYNYFNPKLKEIKSDQLYFKIYMPLINEFIQWSYEGALVDKQYLLNLKQVYTSKLAEIEKKVTELAGYTINVKSSTQISELLFKKLGLKSLKQNKTIESTDKEALKSLKDAHPIIPLLLEHRERSMILDTFIEGFLNSMDSNNRLHTQYNVGLLDTSRISSSNPNLQNLPRTNKDIKKAFIADPGYIYYEFDFSQIEIRMLAEVANDEVLINELNSGKDIHRIIASTAFKIPEDQVSSDLRSRSKAISFGIIYGMGPDSLAAQVKVSKQEALKIIHNFYEKYKGVKQWMTAVRKFAKQHKYIYSYFGRKRYLPGYYTNDHRLISFSDRVSVNTPIQSFAADVANLSIIKVGKCMRPKGVRPVLQIHDALVALLPIETHESLYKECKQIMETTVPLKVKTPVGIKRGFNLGEMEEIK
jgi:DNA polymerase-1